MKIGILTWYKALNHGAVLQTYASCKVLECLGVSPVVLDYCWNLNENNDLKGKILRYIKKFSIRQVLWHVKVKSWRKEKKRAFDSFVQLKLPLGDIYNREKGLDAAYIGSDMVFDFSEGYNPFMYGIDVPADYVFSYAASFGYSTIDMLEAFPNRHEIVTALKKLKAVGYRDQNTLDILRHYGADVPVFECIDPVLLYGFKQELDEWDSGKWNKRKYIVIYAYDSTMNDIDTVNKIKEIARTECLEVISCGYYHKWCDSSVPASPEEFVEMIKNATYVITDTFHGTVFSTIMHKQFVSIVRKNAFKLKYFLEQSGLSSQICCETQTLPSILHKKVEYQDFDRWLLEKRDTSMHFVKNNVEAAGQGKI